MLLIFPPILQRTAAVSWQRLLLIWLSILILSLIRLLFWPLILLLLSLMFLLAFLLLLLLVPWLQPPGCWACSLFVSLVLQLT